MGQFKDKILNLHQNHFTKANQTNVGTLKISNFLFTINMYWVAYY